MDDNNTRKLEEGWFEKARNQLDAAKAHLNSHVRPSEAIETAQESIELSVKSMLSLLGIDYALTHGWSNDALTRIAEQIQKRQLPAKLRSQGLYYSTRIPRLLLLSNLWAHFYLAAKYGMEQSNLAPPQELFEEKEAQLAVQHAEECYRAVSEIIYLSQEKLLAIKDG